MSLYVNAQCQARDDDNVWQCLMQLCHETLHVVASILAALSGANDAHDVLGIQWRVA